MTKITLFAIALALLAIHVNSMQTSTEKNQRYQRESLTPEEVKMIQDSWAVAYKDPLKTGSSIFGPFLEKYNYYGMFPKFKGIPPADVAKSDIFKQHVTKIFAQVNDFIGKLDKGPELVKIMLDIGVIHRKRGATRVHFDNLFNMARDVLARDFNIDEATQKAWDKGAAIVIPMIEEGMNSRE